MMEVKRVFLLVLDSFGIGAEPDAAEFGDGDVNTLRSCFATGKLELPHMSWFGLFNIEGVGCGEPFAKPAGAFARLREKSRGKDTVTGHWEIGGVVSDGMPTFPDGFPPELIEKLTAAFGKNVFCNKPYSGTQVIVDYGQEHERTGCPIVYTSADSVLQIAAHEDVISREELYELCRKAREICQGPWGVGRIIARPFVGAYPDYTRTAGRHDFALEPPAETLLDALAKKGDAVISIGKIKDIFAGRGITRHIAMDGNDDGMKKALSVLNEDFRGLCFVNLVDFDMQYGHRRDADGYTAALNAFDGQLAEFVMGLHYDDVLILTADHGCDPCAAGTDHTREYVPFLAFGTPIRPGVDLGTRDTFADLGATVAHMLKSDYRGAGESFWPQISK